jgi:hypothetical protein
MQSILKNFYHTWRPKAILPVSRARWTDWATDVDFLFAGFV